MSLSPTPTPEWDRKNSTNIEQNTMASFRTPTPEHLERPIENDEENYAPVSPHGMIEKTSLNTMTQSTMTTSHKIVADSDRLSRDGSETDLMPLGRDCEHRISGLWSHAFAILERR
jgi:hypothetical protein